MNNRIAWRKMEKKGGAVYGHPAFTYYRACPICNNIDSRPVWGLKQFQFFIDNASLSKQIDINVHQCNDCYALYMNPNYTQLGFEHLFSLASCSYGSFDFDFRVNEEIEWLKQRDLLKPNIHVLDVGCYKGDFLNYLPGYTRCTGVDIDKTAIDMAQSRYGSSRMNFICADFESFQLTDFPDLITMFHVLEHLPNPLNVLTKLRELADKNTQLVIEVPIIENGFTNDINGFFSVQHMTHFSRNSLRNITQIAGWRIEEMFEQKDYNGCRVVCKPDIQNCDITRNINEISLCYQYLSHWYQNIVNIENVLKGHLDNNQWVIWGAGLHTEFIFQVSSFFLGAGNEREYIIIDNDKGKQGKSWRSINIYSPDALRGIELDKVKFLISSYGSQTSIEDYLLQEGVPQENIVKLYEQLRVY
ncbi:MAG: class I SAM-dependent methyltransferase [Syntrophomonadaceae bacterium]|nr:class I SAM-dependent methyltransferase [Syntrophomonadaceae bacterium]